MHVLVWLEGRDVSHWQSVCFSDLPSKFGRARTWEEQVQVKISLGLCDRQTMHTKVAKYAGKEEEEKEGCAIVAGKGGKQDERLNKTLLSVRDERLYGWLRRIEYNS